LGKTAVVSVLIHPDGNLYGNPANAHRTITLNQSNLDWNEIYTPGQPSLPATVTLRFYGINTIDPITSIILLEDNPGSAAFSDLTPDYCNDGGRTLPHTHTPVNGLSGLFGLPIWATGHTKVPFTTYFDTTVTPSQITRNNFYDFQRVRDAQMEKRITEVTIPKGMAQDKTQYVDITMNLPPDGQGWYVFFLTSLGWVIGHTNPALNAPNRLQNTLFWINPHRLMSEEGYWVDVNNNYYQGGITNGNRPSSFAPGTGIRVIPIAHHINDDTTSILKRPVGASSDLGELVHDATSGVFVNTAKN
jgi:hypothetical protein